MSSSGPRHRSAESTRITTPHAAPRDYNAITPTTPQTSPPTGTSTADEPSSPRPHLPSAPAERSRWAEFWEKWGSVELENKGSVARDHLALERTFLAWLRTSLSFASIGIAITQLFRLNSSLRSDTTQDPQNPTTTHSLHTLRHLGKPLGATFLGISILLLLIGFHRYFEAQHYVIRGKFPASRGSIVLVSGVAGALIVTSLVVILATGEGVWEV